MIFDFRNLEERCAALALNPLFPIAYDYWRRLAAHGLPQRGDIDPTAIPAVLPNIMLLDVLDEGLDFRYRLAGTNVERNFGSSVKGIILSQVVQAFPSFQPIIEVKQHCAATASPYACDEAIFTHFGTQKRVYCCAMPLSDDGATISHIFAVGILEPVENAKASAD
ncbi:MAG: PAS domain-containing protein [Dongiaceae bacterium]